MLLFAMLLGAVPFAPGTSSWHRRQQDGCEIICENRNGSATCRRFVREPTSEPGFDRPRFFGPLCLTLPGKDNLRCFPELCDGAADAGVPVS